MAFCFDVSLAAFWLGMALVAWIEVSDKRGGK